MAPSERKNTVKNTVKYSKFKGMNFDKNISVFGIKMVQVSNKRADPSKMQTAGFTVISIENNRFSRNSDLLVDLTHKKFYENLGKIADEGFGRCWTTKFRYVSKRISRKWVPPVALLVVTSFSSSPL